MALSAKQQQKCQKRLTKLRARMPSGCWVCAARRGLKTHRMALAVRCRQCFDAGRHTAETVEFERLRDALR